LMVNHPHDCPICDEGGECQLQDLTIATGQGIRRYEGPKRTFQNQHLGEFIQHEMNRCITCYRCSRFYQEYAGGRDFGPTGSRDRVYFGRFEEGPLESPFSGNLVEMCPTGVFTDKLFRYRSRVWDLEIAPSVCPHCSVGCNVHPGARHRELQRVRVRENPAVNGVFLCDRGQFGHAYVMDPERPREVRVHGQASTWEEALGLAGGTLLATAHEHGAASIALVGSPRASLETHAALAALATGPLEGTRVSHFDDPARESRALAALAALRRAKVAPLEQSDIAGCDVLVVAGTSLVDEAPLAALAARQAARNGARLFVLNAGEHYLADVAERTLAVHPARLGETLEGLAGRIGSAGAGGNGGPDDAARLAGALRDSERPGILLGLDLFDGPAFAAGAVLTKALVGAGKKPRFGTLFPGPNGFGAAALSRSASLDAVLRDLAAGKLRAMVLVEGTTAEWPREAREALAKLEMLVVLDYLPGLGNAAHVMLPTSVTYESSGIYVNRAGRAQAFAPARAPGLSVEELISHETFPRDPRLTPPAGAARPAWWALEAMRERALGRPQARSLTGVRVGLSQRGPFWEPVRDLIPGGEGAPLDPALLEIPDATLASFGGGDGLAIYRMDRTLGSETLSQRSAPMRAMAGPPVALLSPADAERGRVNGRVAVRVGTETVEMAARVRDTVPPGVVLVPRDVEWGGGVQQGARVEIAAATAEEVRA
jgi:NADH-quinone oxidoreductase subunit G